MMNGRDISHSKSLGDLGREAFWFLSHTLIAIVLLVSVIVAVSLNHPDPDSTTPKVLTTLLAALIPMLGGAVIARVQRNDIAPYTWISGLVIFSIVCVWVLDLPTGKGLCENCGAVDKLWRTFFTFRHGSGLMGGDGLLIGTWLPLSTIGYAIGARLAHDPY
jgi:small basic protein